jgi:hypothetical protein
MSLMMEGETYVNHFWMPTTRFDDLDNKNEPSPVNQILRTLIFQAKNPLFEHTPLAL